MVQDLRLLESEHMKKYRSTCEIFDVTIWRTPSRYDQFIQIDTQNSKLVVPSKFFGLFQDPLHLENVVEMLWIPCVSQHDM